MCWIISGALHLMFNQLILITENLTIDHHFKSALHLINKLSY